jgi:hypothetical protein
MPIQSSPESSLPDPESLLPPDPEFSPDPPSSPDADPELSSDPLPLFDPEPSEEPESSDSLELEPPRLSPPPDAPPWSSPSAPRPGLRVGSSSGLIRASPAPPGLSALEGVWLGRKVGATGAAGWLRLDPASANAPSVRPTVRATPASPRPYAKRTRLPTPEG